MFLFDTYGDVFLPLRILLWLHLKYVRKICLKMLSIIINVFWEVNLICLQTELTNSFLSVYKLLLNKFLWLFFT